ncbi:MAG: DUF7305 domain-containing protein [Archangium sp.]
MRALPLVVLVAACAPPPSDAIDYRTLERGGAFDVRRCGAAPDPVRAFPANEWTREASLAICGDLRSDNTTTVAGDLRVQGTTRVSSPVNVNGSFFAGGNVDCPNTLNVSGDFSTSGDWSVSSPANIGGDALIGGTLRHDNRVQVNGALNVVDAVGAGALNVGSRLTSPGDIVAPLDCDNAPDVHAIADALTDEYFAPWLRDDRRFVISQPTDITFGCGRYLMNGFETNNTLMVHIAGPTQLVIRGDMRIGSPTRFVIENGGSLELIVDGALNVDNTLDVDAAVVAVSGPVRIASPTHVTGLFLAPRSSISADNTLDVYGTMFAGSTRVASPLVIHRGPQN